MRRVTCGLALCAVLSGACTGAPEPLPSDYIGSPVPRRTTSYVEPVPYHAPTIDDSVDSDLRTEVETLLLPQIRRKVELAPLCRPTPNLAELRRTGHRQRLQCTALVEGVEVPFDVEISGFASPYYDLDVTQRRGLLLRAAVRDAWATEARYSETPLSCEKSLPRATLVPQDKPTRYRCATDTRLVRVMITETRGVVFEPIL